MKIIVATLISLVFFFIASPAAAFGGGGRFLSASDSVDEEEDLDFIAAVVEDVIDREGSLPRFLASKSKRCKNRKWHFHFIIFNFLANNNMLLTFHVE